MIIEAPVVYMRNITTINYANLHCAERYEAQVKDDAKKKKWRGEPRLGSCCTDMQDG